MEKPQEIDLTNIAAGRTKVIRTNTKKRSGRETSSKQIAFGQPATQIDDTLEYTIPIKMVVFGKEVVYTSPDKGEFCWLRLQQNTLSIIQANGPEPIGATPIIECDRQEEIQGIELAENSESMDDFLPNIILTLRETTKLRKYTSKIGGMDQPLVAIRLNLKNHILTYEKMAGYLRADEQRVKELDAMALQIRWQKLTNTEDTGSLLSTKSKEILPGEVRSNFSGNSKATLVKHTAISINSTAETDTELERQPTPEAFIPELSIHEMAKEAGNKCFIVCPQAEHTEDADLAEASQRVTEKYKEVSDILKKGTVILRFAVITAELK